MKILVTIQSIINYLKNHIIPMVWTDKIKFSDGTEQTTAVSSGGGFSLYDIKTLAETVANKGWCCISNKKVLPKTSNPTVYNDIKNKYDNADITNTDTLQVVNSNMNYDNAMPKIVGEYVFAIKNNGIYKCELYNLNDNNNWQKVFDIPNTYDEYNLGRLFGCIFAENVICVTAQYIGMGDNDILYVFDYDGNILKTFTISHIDNGKNNLSLLDGYIYFNTVVSDKTYTIDLIKIPDIANSSIEAEVVANIEYEIWNLKYAFNKWWFGYGERDSLYCATDLNDNSTFEKKVDNCTGTFCIYEDKNFIQSGGGNWGMTSNDGGKTFMRSVYNFSFAVGDTYIYQPVKNSKSLIFVNGEDNSNNKIFMLYQPPYPAPIIFKDIVADYVIPFYWNYNSVAFNDNIVIFGIDYNYCYINFTKKVFTDTYNINGNTINISYYFHSNSQTKIVLGTSQNTDIDTVTEYLGYNPYFVLDTTTDSESVQLPINTNLWTYMYVGDDIIDSNIPSGKYINLKTVGETIVNDNASVTVDIKANKHYKFTNSDITDITINSVEDSINETVIKFSTGNTAPTLTDNSGIDWYDGVPVLNANSSYTIVIYDSTAYWLEK